MPSFVQGKGGAIATTATPNVAFTSNTTAGNAIIAHIAWTAGSGTITSVTDSQGNTYVLLGILSQGQGRSSAIYAAFNVAGGACTVTGHLSASQPSAKVSVAEFSGVSRVSEATSQNSAAATTSPTSGSVITANSNDLLIAVYRGGSISAAGSGWTLVAGTGMEYQIAVSPGLYSGTWTTTSVAYVGNIVALLPPVPVVTVQAATSVGTNSATLNGTIVSENGGGNSTIEGFQWGLTTAYGNTININGSFTTGAFSSDLASLIPGITYHYRAFATNPNGIGFSFDQTFTTVPTPLVTVQAATLLTTTSATLNGNITSETGGGNSTVEGFEWGLTTSYGNTINLSGSFATGPFSSNLTGLTPGTTYHYRAFATNSRGMGVSEDITFTTLPTNALVVTYTPANLSPSADAALYGGTDLLVLAGTLRLNFNRPSVDAFHLGYWPLNDGGGNGSITAADISTNANNGALYDIDGHAFDPRNPWLSPASSYAGNSALDATTGVGFEVGNVLEYERTQPWTVMVAIKLFTKCPAGGASVIFSNVPATGPNYPGYELWVDQNGKLRVRIISSIVNNYIGLIGNTNVVDSTWHFVAATYDGSSKAAGVKIYLDGVPQTLSVESDTLTASIVASGQSIIIGNQAGRSITFQARGYIDEFSISDVVRSAAYIAAHSTPSSLPPIDANTQLYCRFDEGVGNTAYDSSGNVFNAVFSGLHSTEAESWTDVTSLYMDGLGTYVRIPFISAYNLGNTFTISAWGNSLSPPDSGTIISDASVTSPFAGWLFAGGYRKTIQWDSGAPNFVDSTIAATAGWHHYAVRFKSGTLDFLVDGVIVKTLTGLPAPTTVNVPLAIGYYKGVGGWRGYLGDVRISNTNRSDSYLQQFAKRFPSSGTVSLSNVSGSIISGGGNFGSAVVISQLNATFNLPPTTNITYRIGMGATASDATANKQSQSFQTLNATNGVSMTGQYVDYDIQLFSSTDSLASISPKLWDLTLFYNHVHPMRLV